MPLRTVVDKVVAYQEKRFREEGASARGLDWKSAEAQELNFRALMSMMPDRSGSVLDVGCGLAHLRDFLAANGFTGDYTGIDVSPVLIEEARRLRPGLDLRVHDLLADPPLPRAFDYVVASGVFSARLDTPSDEFEDYAARMVEAMYGLCRRATAFNMLTSFVDFEAPHLYYGDPGDWLHRGRRLSRFLRLHHDSDSYFFVLGIYRGPNDGDPVSPVGQR